MENRYRNNLKKVFLSDSELGQLKHCIDQSGCQSFSEYARRTLLDPGMNFITIDTTGYQDLVFELKRIGNNINQIARSVNQSQLISNDELQNLKKGISELIREVEKEFSIQAKKLREFHGHH
ncbi:TPA: MobC family plasmid mobilization relaxosome protein [Streptococcus pyogenes]|uniref:MobC family plasmid mobilization relaxosome protein n=1 Tax=Streptococcus TaxID=1301 RepID=UPI00193153CB|nr:MobC family plasmid mobilization relaxosome protein [Streptococcus mitis]MDU5705821.1 MobC family plasmid mobilization relaxosome protein [Streptococcus parasanguinis]HER0002670.1 MobC family plasmid mobilization relaxosome protein [Streptococcus pyogenes]MDU5844074.1 MobC family plasmid mobilization relaxosome protein [Streptococcus parasanguinis]HER6661481.1 MobC family plasmid mobilization relaxosome protein [Streptococcus pyogenes]HER6663327.1 MobC family plasmid mobilization relaxosome